MAYTPGYERIAADLRARITSGDIPIGGSLPSMAQLCQQYGVSNTVVRAALLLLRAEGLTEGRQGVGVFVVRRP